MAEEIRRLPETVVNRIAAGEIVQRPANALKELIENSLDAKSSTIQITVKAGGLKYIQIQDNGTGIRRDSLSIVCERFTTSKLQKFEDLNNIETYGFRGEALASISHIAHLTIQTKTQDEKCAYRATYEDGVLKGSVVPCAGNRGTQITVEDLFYNVIARKKALRSPSEEYQKIFEVVGNYAVHNFSVGFVLKKFGENVDLRTPVKSTCIDNIRTVYGNTIAKELIEISGDDSVLKLKIHGYITNVNYSTKKGVLLLFINHRLVESSAIKKNIDFVYSTYLPKNGHSFVYLSLELDPQNVDVNVHPTKHEVHFLFEEQIIEKIKTILETKLLSCGTSRVLYVQSKLPGFSITDFQYADDTAKNTEKTVQAKNLVRVYSNDQKLDKFFGLTKIGNASKDNEEHETKVNICTVEQQTNETNIDNVLNVDEEKPAHKSPKLYNPSLNMNSTASHIAYINPKDSFKSRQFSTQRAETRLTSVKTLRMEVEEKCSIQLREILANLIFIGCVDETKVLIQHSTKMYLCNTIKLMEELFYEVLLYDFQNFGIIKFTTPLAIYDLAILALDLPVSGWSPEDGEKSTLAEQVKNLLVSKAPMLLEYFSLEINNDGFLISLPLLLENYSPFMGALPLYVLRLATEVDWDVEKECFKTFCRETAMFYSQQNSSDDEDTTKQQKWVQEHVIFDAIRKYFLPPKEFMENGTILQVANLPDLYKVFERC